jgi:ABC-type Fe3+-hydroxamate transport system substrate-binding protein
MGNYPQRIISLVPSQTELLFHLELEDETVGITRFCIHPETWYRSKKRVGGTKDLHLDLIRDLQPDLVIANKEENNREQVLAISQYCPVWTSDISNLSDALEMIREIGRITNRTEKAASLAKEIGYGFESLPPIATPIPAAYLIWKEPYMAAGGDCFIHQMMTKCGLANVFEAYNRYPVIALDDLRRLSPKLILLSSEPYPFKEAHEKELMRQLPESRVLRVNGEMFSWYGSRVLLSAAYFRELQQQFQAVLPGTGNCV